MNESTERLSCEALMAAVAVQRFRWWQRHGKAFKDAMQTLRYCVTRLSGKLEFGYPNHMGEEYDFGCKAIRMAEEVYLLRGGK